MHNYRLSIITPNGKIFEGLVEFLNAPGTLGALGILPRHTALITTLKKGILSIVQEEAKNFFCINSGVLEVDGNNRVLLLADQAIPAENEAEAALKINSMSS